MTDDEFAARVYLRLADAVPQIKDLDIEERLYEVLEGVRGIEREETSRQLLFLERRQDIHPVCKY